MSDSAQFNELYRSAWAIPEPFSDLSEEERKTADDLLRRFEELSAQHGEWQHADVLRPMLLSKNGRYAEALAYTSQRYEQAPGWPTAVAAANAARRGGDLETAVVMFARGAEHDPHDVACHLEIGDIRLGQARWIEALAAYELALAKDAEHPWALPSAFYCRWRITGQSSYLDSLREVAQQEGCTCGLQECLTSMFGGYGSEDAIARAQSLLAMTDGA